MSFLNVLVIIMWLVLVIGVATDKYKPSKRSEILYLVLIIILLVAR